MPSRTCNVQHVRSRGLVIRRCRAGDPGSNRTRPPWVPRRVDQLHGSHALVGGTTHYADHPTKQEQRDAKKYGIHSASLSHRRPRNGDRPPRGQPPDVIRGEGSRIVRVGRRGHGDERIYPGTRLGHWGNEITPRRCRRGVIREDLVACPWRGNTGGSFSEYRDVRLGRQPE